MDHTGVWRRLCSGEPGPGRARQDTVRQQLARELHEPAGVAEFRLQHWPEKLPVSANAHLDSHLTNFLNLLLRRRIGDPKPDSSQKYFLRRADLVVAGWTSLVLKAS